MTEIADRYAALVAGFASRLDGTGPDAWANPSPCAEWTARGVAGHVVGIAQRMTATASGAPAPEGDPGPDEDLSALYKEATTAVLAALSDPAVAERLVPSPFGEMPFEQLIGRLIATDTLVHTWDLARATGQDERLPPEAVSGAYAGLKPLDEMIRMPGVFDAKLTPPDGADEQMEFLCFLGRAV